MRLWHTSDTHLGHQQYPRTGPDGLNVRETDIAAAWLRVVDGAVAARPDAFLHAGDLFDGVRPGNRALHAALEGFLRLDRAGIPTVVIAGNHETPRMRQTGSPFRLFEHLPNIHVVYRGRREQVDLDTPSGPLRVQAVPQCPDADALRDEVAAVEAAPMPQVLMLHGGVLDMEAFAHAEFNEQTLDPSWFDDRFDYVALGHFHGCREVTPRAWYCGAPERMSIAEAGEEKGHLDVRLDEEGVQARFVPVAGRPYIDLPRLDARGLDGSQVLEAARQAMGRVPEGAVARLRIDGLARDLRGALDLSALRRAGAQALHLDLRLDWRDAAGAVAGGLELRGLREEFETYLAQRPVEGLDRARLLRLAQEVLDPA